MAPANVGGAQVGQVVLDILTTQDRWDTGVHHAVDKDQNRTRQIGLRGQPTRHGKGAVSIGIDVFPKVLQAVFADVFRGWVNGVEVAECCAPQCRVQLRNVAILLLEIRPELIN